MLLSFLVVVALVSISAIVSKAKFGSLFAPMGLYALIWGIVSGLYLILASPPNDLYFEAREELFYVLSAAMLVFDLGCLLGNRHAGRSERAAADAYRVVPVQRFRSAFRVIVIVGAVTPALLYGFLFLGGVAGVSGDEARDVLISQGADVLGKVPGLVFGYAVYNVGFAFVMLGCIFAAFGLVSGLLSWRWAFGPVLSGAAIDFLQQGRLWTSVNVLVFLLAWGLSPYIARFTAVAIPEKRGKKSVASLDTDPRISGKHLDSRRRLGTALALGVVLYVAFATYGSTMQRREGLQYSVERSPIALGPVSVPSVLAGPLIYVVTPTAFMNVYLGQDRTLPMYYGLIGLWGGVDLVLYPVFRTSLVPEMRGLGDWMTEYYRSILVGPLMAPNSYFTYLRTAMDDFGQAGLVIYPLFLGFVSTKVYLRMKRSPSIETVCLYMLFGFVILMTPLRWQFSEPHVWLTGLGIILLGRWMNQEAVPVKGKSDVFRN